VITAGSVYSASTWSEVHFCSLWQLGAIRSYTVCCQHLPLFRVMTIVRCGTKLQTSNLVVMRQTLLPKDKEGERLFALYEASSAKEHTAASRLLTPHRDLSNAAYLKLLTDLRVIRTECNADMLAIAEHHEKMRELLTVH
jgi:hypothetical protein